MIRAENQSIPTPPPPPVAPVAKNRRRVWIAVSLIAMLAVASASAALVLTNPNILASGQTISLSYNYKIGQKMTYEMDLSMNIPGIGDETQTTTVSEEILDFDGSTYTVQTIASAPGTSAQTNVMKMDKTGRITDYGDVSSTVQSTFNSLFSMPGFGSYFPRQEAKVGETWTIPMTTTILGLNTQGTVTNKITEIGPITTAGGTFNAFKTEMNSQMKLTTHDPTGEEGSMSINANGYSYMEQGTCIPLRFKIDLSMTLTASGQTQTLTASMSMDLTEFTPGTS